MKIIKKKNSIQNRTSKKKKFKNIFSTYKKHKTLYLMRLSWLWSYGNLIYNYLCNQCLSPLMLWVRTSLRRGILNITLCDKVCQWLAAGRWFSPGTPVSFPNKTNCHDITEILLKVALNTITLTLFLTTPLGLWFIPKSFPIFNLCQPYLS